MKGREITRAVKLFDEKGKLNQVSVGWARHPMVYCNLKGSFLRKKKWNYWCMTNREALFSVTVSHLDYAAVIFAYIYDFTTRKFVEKSILIPLGKGLSIPDNVQDSIYFKGKGVHVSIKDEEHVTKLNVSWLNFFEDKPLEAQFNIVRKTDHESLNVVIPWSNSRFQFTSKQVALPTEGKVSWSQGDYTFQMSDSFATLDFGRGKWPYRSKWNWGAASGFADGYRIGLNFGGQWTDNTGQTENGIIIDQKLHKIHEDLDWVYDHHDYMKPWVIHSPNNKRVKLMFKPIFERVSKTNLGIIKSNVHQMIGYYSGTVETDDGQTIQIQRLLGWAEDHQARW
ncbi:DUF2804 domain-containing protein [Piscibacillus halophilus]|uniref:DUF2804 domain-containing protein n=1 Tax=Piscibacillus halophilus TaxID=571933 RepID=UPI00158CD061|nr:DUF2804 domain-containing protein [Piscibacillus halophilus]